MNGRLFMLALGVYRIGKAPRDLPDSKSIVVPNDKWMSKDHAVVIVEAGQVLLTDPGSTNGSFVNGEKVARAVLENGDELRLGESVFRFTLLGS
ncbi:MAG: FHA domain-containing protein [Candidatus Eisenbacteria bacterium]